jgi:hypothetical protein
VATDALIPQNPSSLTEKAREVTTVLGHPSRLATKVSDLLLNELLAALFQEFEETIQRVSNTWYYRRSIALSNKFHSSCVLATPTSLLSSSRAPAIPASGWQH